MKFIKNVYFKEDAMKLINSKINVLRFSGRSETRSTIKMVKSWHKFDFNSNYQAHFYAKLQIVRENVSHHITFLSHINVIRTVSPFS